MRDRIGNEGFIKGLIGLLIFAAVVFAGISFGKPYYRYHTFSSRTSDILRLEIGNLQNVKERILAEAEELGIPVQESDVSVTREKQVVKVRATWSETVDFWGYYQKKFDFVMEEEL